MIFENAFIQAMLREEVYVELPEMVHDKQNHGSKDSVVLELNMLL
jgi:hypothetical protein